MQVGPDRNDVDQKPRGGIVTRLLSRMTPNCKEMARFLSEGMDRPLPIGTRIKMRLHLLICEACARYRKQLRAIRQALGRHPDNPEGQRGSGVSPLSAEAKARLHQALKSRKR